MHVIYLPTYLFVYSIHLFLYLICLSIYIGVSENSGTPKSSILMGFSIINHPFWGTPYFWKHPYLYNTSLYIECIYIYILNKFTPNHYMILQSHLAHTFSVFHRVDPSSPPLKRFRSSAATSRVPGLPFPTTTPRANP